MTSRPIVAFCRSVPPPVDVGDAEIRMGGQRAFARDQLLAFVAGASVVVTWVSERVDRAFLDACGPNLKAICQFAVGVDNTDLEACRERGVVVTNTPGAVTEGTADLAWTLILGVARRIVVADRFARGAEYPKVGPLGPDEFIGQSLTGKNLLIVGAGRIGYATALRSLGWGMRVSYVARSRHMDFEMAPLGATRVELEAGLRTADVVSLHTPLTPETRGLMNAARLAMLKPDAILINTARGPIVDEAALVEVLRAGSIWGAGLDVFEQEPRVHPGLIGLENCVLAPHIGSANLWSRPMMTRMVCENTRAILAGKKPPNPVP